MAERVGLAVFGVSEEKRDGYARISCPGGRDFWVEERFVVYPPVD